MNGLQVRGLSQTPCWPSSPRTALPSIQCGSSGMRSNELVAQLTVGPDDPCRIELLRDNAKTWIRPTSRQHVVEERAFIEALSPEARRSRVLGQLGHPTSDLIAQFTRIDYDHELAFAAVIASGTREQILGITRYGHHPGWIGLRMRSHGPGCVAPQGTRYRTDETPHRGRTVARHPPHVFDRFGRERGHGRTCEIPWFHGMHRPRRSTQTMHSLWL